MVFLQGPPRLSQAVEVDTVNIVDDGLCVHGSRLFNDQRCFFLDFSHFSVLMILSQKPSTSSPRPPPPCVRSLKFQEGLIVIYTCLLIYNSFVMT